MFWTSPPLSSCHTAVSFSIHLALGPSSHSDKGKSCFLLFLFFFFFFFTVPCASCTLSMPTSQMQPSHPTTHGYPLFFSFLFFSFLSVFVSIGLLFSIFSFLPSAFCFLFTFYFFLFLLFCFLFFYSVFFSTFLFLHSFLVLAVVLLNKYPNIIVDCNEWKQYNFF